MKERLVVMESHDLQTHRNLPTDLAVSFTKISRMTSSGITILFSSGCNITHGILVVAILSLLANFLFIIIYFAICVILLPGFLLFLLSTCRIKIVFSLTVKSFFILMKFEILPNYPQSRPSLKETRSEVFKHRYAEEDVLWESKEKFPSLGDEEALTQMRGYIADLLGEHRNSMQTEAGQTRRVENSTECSHRPPVWFSMPALIVIPPPTGRSHVALVLRAHSWRGTRCSKIDFSEFGSSAEEVPTVAGANTSVILADVFSDEELGSEEMVLADSTGIRLFHDFLKKKTHVLTSVIANSFTETGMSTQEELKMELEAMHKEVCDVQMKIDKIEREVQAVNRLTLRPPSEPPGRALQESLQLPDRNRDHL